MTGSPVKRAAFCRSKDMVAPANMNDGSGTLQERMTQAKDKVLGLQSKIDELKSSRFANWSSLQAIAQSMGVLQYSSSLKVRRLLKGHFGKVYATDWAGSGNELVSASQDGKLIIWDAMLNAKIQAIPLRSSWVMTCAFEKTQDQLVACGGLDNLCTIYKLNEGEDSINRAHRELTGHDGYLSSCSFVGADKIVTSSGDSTCMLWDIETGAITAKFEEHEQDVMSVDVLVHMNPNIFISGSCDATAKVWDSRSGECTMTLSGHSNDINAVSFFPEGHSFATGSDDSSVRIFDIRAAAEMASFRSDSILCGVTSVSVSKSGRYIFGGYDDYNCYKWDTLGSVKEPAQQLVGHDNRVSCVRVSPVGNAVCTGSWDATLRIWA